MGGVAGSKQAFNWQALGYWAGWRLGGGQRGARCGLTSAI